MPSQSHSQSSLDEKYNGLMQAHESLINQMRGMIVPKSPIEEGVFVDEWISSNSSPAQLTLQIDRPALITSILYAMDTTGAASLQIGPQSGTMRFIPLLNANLLMMDGIKVEMIVKPGDVFILTNAAAGKLFLEVMGKLLSGTNWSVI